MRNSRKVFLRSIWVLVLCITMFIGTTLAWFTDNATSSGNIIKAGELDLKMYWTDDLDGNTWYDVEDPERNTIFNYDNWEPGYTEVRYIKLVNAGNLALNYKLALTPQNGVGKLAEVINVYFAEGKVELNTREDLKNLNTIGLLNNVVNNGVTANGTILANSQTSPIHKSGEVILTLATSMITSAGNEYQNESSGEFTITALATQAPFEGDSFGTSYDSNAKYPVITTPGKASASVSPVNGKVPAGGVTLAGEGISAYVPEGVALEDGANKLTLSITPLENTASGISVVNNEILIPVDVHIDGIAENNTVPIIVDLGAVLPKYLNMGNYHLFHVEEDGLATMSLVESKAELTAHNQFTYNSDTGEVSVAMTSFSEVALLADTENGWQGDYDYDFVGQGTEDNPYIISKADELAGFGAIVGGMNGKEAQSYDGVHFKLISDINLGDGETASNNGVVKTFYPIGYYNSTGEYHDRESAVSVEGEVVSNVSSFEGTFDGNGHKISNFYQNTWEMFGDYNDGYSGKPNYYKDAMGLFGYVNGGTIKNLTVDHFSSDGEFTPTGVIAAYAAEANFENIAITNCNPRVYNTGNGGIVGIGGNSSDTNEKALNFTNITIDNTNKISALWGSWDVACGGVMGMFRGWSKVHFENCHVAAQIDVYNDVCGNYQYYWYRYSGMMIGSLRGRNTTDAEGYTVPNMEGITAKESTVHFGKWNDYYYCELVANSLASYTHDHQFSRLEQITSLDEIKEGEKWIKNGNFLLITEDDKICYHIMKDKDGNLYEHKHDVADATNEDVYETIDGKSELKEDKQIIYLPFNQLFQGDGWGVKHIPIYDDGTSYFEGITILDRQDAKSDEKFEMLSNVANSYVTDTEVSIGELFADVAPEKNGIKGDRVKVFVSPEGDGSTAGGVYTANESDWTKGTLKFTGSGKATISITDYYYCKTTTIEVTIIDGTVEKFDKLFKNDYLYRVGNQNTVPVGSLFAAIDHVPDEEGDGRPDFYIDKNSVSITIEKYDENTNVSGTYTANESNWTKGTIQLSGTGVVKVSIKDDNGCEPTELYLEVVDACNVTAYSGGNYPLKNYNTTSVLLNDITMSANSSFYLNGGATLYGNGFTFDCQKGAYTASGSVSENYVIGLIDAHLDNVKIIGKVYTTYGAQASNDYNRALVVSKGNSSITNCYLSNTASPIRLVEGSLEVKGTTVKGGNFANIDLRNGHLTVEDVTTINQTLGNDKAEDGTTVIGLGIVVFYENVDPSLTSIDIKGTLKQYNHISSNDKFSHDYATQFVNQMMTGDYGEYRTEIDGVKWVNTGVIALTDNIEPIDERNNKDGYIGKEVSFMAADGYVYSVKPTAATVQEAPSEYKTLGQGLIAPVYSFDYTTKNYIQKTDGSNDYCYYENGKVLIAMDEGEAFEWDPFILSATKNGKTLDYTVSYGGKTYAEGQKIAFDTSGDYEVTYSYTDNGNYTLDENRNLAPVEHTYTKTVSISVSVIKPSAQHATFTFADTNTATEKVTVNDKTYISAQGVSVTDKEWGYITVNNTKIFYPITEAQMKKNLLGTEVQVYYYVFEDAVTITDYQDGGTGGEQIYNASTTTMPSNLSVVNGMEAKYTDINSACVDISKLTKDGPSGEVWDFSASTTVSGTTTYSGYLAHSSPSGLSIKTGSRDYDAITVAQFSYTDAAGATYYYFVGYFMPNQVSSSSAGTSPCVTKDTLVTLADGTSKRIDEITYNDKLLVWNFFEGIYDVAPAAIIFDHGADNNTVIQLTFDDGTTVKVVNMHQFFDADLNKFITITKDNVVDYVGHQFAKFNGKENKFVELVEYSVADEYVEAWGVMTAEHYNIIVAGMLSADFDMKDVELFNYFEVGEGMRFDETRMQTDIEKYGLYTYEDFADYLTYEQFEAFNVKYMKIAVGKGNYTYQGILELIAEYLNN